MSKKLKKTVIFIVLLSIILIVLGYIFIKSEYNSTLNARYGELHAVNKFKRDQVVQFHTERMADISIIAESPYIKKGIEQWKKDKFNPQLRDELIQFMYLLRDAFNCKEIKLISLQGDNLLNPLDSDFVKSPYLPQIQECAYRHDVLLLDLYMCEYHNVIHHDIFAPVILNTGEISGIFVFRIDPEISVFPLFREWPGKSKTAEVMIVRQEKDSVLYLNHIDTNDINWRLRLSLQNSNLPAAMAVEGKTGLVHGIDYKGNSVIADIEKVPGTSWFVISKINKSEIYETLLINIGVVAFIVLLLIILCIIVAISLYRTRQSRLIKQLYEKECQANEQNEIFRTTLYSIGDGVISTDRDGLVTHMNAVAEHLTGWKESEVKGKALDTVFHVISESTRQPVDNPVKKVLTEGRIVGFSNHTILVSRDGRETPVADSGSPICGSDGNVHGVVMVFQDQTREHERQEAIQKSEQRYRSLFTEMKEGFALHEIICNDEGIPVDYRFITLNPAFEEQTGLKAEVAIGHTIKEIDPDVEPVWIERSGAVALTGIPVTFEKYVLYLKKYYQVVIFCPQKGQFAVLFTDITERKITEAHVLDEKERLKITLASIADGVITTDLQGNIVMMNKSAEILTGWSSDDADTHNVNDVLHVFDENTKTAYNELVNQIVKAGKTVEFTDATLLYAKNGTVLSIELSGTPIRNAEGVVGGVVIVLRNATEKKKLVENMLRAQKLESIGVLAGGIAHDFNNLLGGIFGYIDMAIDSVANRKYDEVSGQLTKAMNVFNRAKALTMQLLTFSKGGSPVRKAQDLTPIIRNSAQFALSGSNIVPEIIIGNSISNCDCDENQIAQVIDNIVINAKQAMPLGGKLIIKTENVDVAKLPPEMTPVNQTYIHISITDQGIGMPKEILSRIFDPFFSTKQTGHGLGLSTVYSIIKRHDGNISVESEQGIGSTFHLYLPASQMSYNNTINPEVIVHKGEGKVLIMDDEEFLLDIVGDILVSLGYTPVKVHNGEEALSVYKESIEKNDPIAISILDLTIPGGIGGREAVTAIRKMNSDAIVIAASGYSDDPVIADPQSSGFSASIAKPFRKKSLIEILDKLNINSRQSIDR
ncbi:MAG: PAS domain S-box protein [Fibrobacter sp.]|nr:PAS domain S-box protein [Fibrobacter sp.]